MICNNNYLADILRVCKIKDLIWVMRFQSPLVYIYLCYGALSTLTSQVCFNLGPIPTRLFILYINCDAEIGILQ